jgi:hypothetical protein
MQLRNFTRATARLLLAAALLVTTLGAGAAAASKARAECPMSRMQHGCCKRARQNRRAPGVVPVRLCCVGNFPQPAPSNPSFTFQSSPGAADTARPSAVQAPCAADSAQPRGYAPPFTPSHSPPAYVRHAAFLI